MSDVEDPWYTAVLYEAHLEHVDPSEPLWGVPYFGQIVRKGIVEILLKTRRGEHNTDSAKEEKVIGFHAVIDLYGADTIEWRVVSYKSGPRSKMRVWANAEEKRLIAENGGVLRDMDERLVQTLNLTEGGQGSAVVFASIDAWRMKHFHIFKMAMASYVEKTTSSLVPFSYVTNDGYPLGQRLSAFRKGHLRVGLPKEDEIANWAASLPLWEWNAVKATANLPERRAENSATVKSWWEEASQSEKSDRISQMKEGQNRTEVLEANSKRATEWWENASDETKSRRGDAQSASVKKTRLEFPENESARIRNVKKAKAAAYQARLDALGPDEREKLENKHARDIRSHRKRQADLALLRTVMPNAKPTDIAKAKREGRMPKPSS